MPDDDPWRKGYGDEPDISIWRPGDPDDKRPAGGRDHAVYLPHSCGEWVVAASPDRAEALAQLDRFIAELHLIREELAGG